MTLTKLFSRIANAMLMLLAVSLTTLAWAYPSPLKVNLGTAGDFAVLAETAITTTTGTKVDGDIGISPAAASYITGFALVSPPTYYTTSAMVTGKVYAADYDPPTPINMGISIGDMYAAYTDAAGRAPDDSTGLGGGDISGLNLAPGVYKWSTGLLINTDVTLTATAATDVWIFQIAGNLTVADAGSLVAGTHIVLAGGALASNVFWQVGGVAGAQIGTYATFNGNILAAKQIVVRTGAVFNGRALSQTQVTLDNNPVSAPLSAVSLKAILAATPATRTATGQSVLLTLTVTNTGSVDAINVTATIWNDGGKGFDGPTPGIEPTLTPGSAVTFTWATTLTGAWAFNYSATASETSQPVSSLRALKVVSLPQPVITGRLTASTPAVSGGPFLVTLTVSNTGLGLGYVALTTTAFRVSGAGSTSTSYAGWNPTATAYVGYGSPVAFTWTVSAGTMGSGFMLSNTLYVTDANGGPALPRVVVTTGVQSATVAPGTSAPSTGTNDSFIYPSPVRDSANITYVMADSGTVKIRVYNAAGQLVASLQESKAAGAQQTAVTTARMAPGVYFYLLERQYGSGKSDKIGPRKFVVTR